MDVRNIWKGSKQGCGSGWFLPGSRSDPREEKIRIEPSEENPDPDTTYFLPINDYLKLFSDIKVSQCFHFGKKKQKKLNFRGILLDRIRIRPYF